MHRTSVPDTIIKSRHLPASVRQEERTRAVERDAHRAATNVGSKDDEQHPAPFQNPCARARPDVRKAYDDVADEFAFLDEVLKARAEAGLAQAEAAARIGTTQSAIAHLESAEPQHSPSIATLQKYANALGTKCKFGRSSKSRGVGARARRNRNRIARLNTLKRHQRGGLKPTLSR